MKTLILCRHAKSDWPPGVSDLHRPLKSRGVRDANFLGGLLADQAFCPDLIYTSPAERARQTAEIIAAKLEFPGKLMEKEEVYFQGVEALMRLVRRVSPLQDTVMIFGHNPTMEEAVQYLLSSGAPFFMPTGAMACLEMMRPDWQALGPGSVSLRWLLIPRLKRKEED